jgi:hypothetical protein
MHDNGPDEIIMGLKLLYLLHCVVIKYPNCEIIGTTDYPLFLHHKSDGADGVYRGLNSSDAGLQLAYAYISGVIVK